MDPMRKLRVAVLVTDGVEESEMTIPVSAIRDRGYLVEVISPTPHAIQAFHHHDKSRKLSVDRLLEDVDPDDYDALLLPGGALNADALRCETKAQQFAQAFDQAKKPIAVICHGPWLLVSAGLVRGRKMTSYYTIQDDLKNAGAQWVDDPAVIDGNWVSSRNPDDIPAFNQAFLKLLDERAEKQIAA